jgi:hypothetical protein
LNLCDKLAQQKQDKFTINTKIKDVISDSAFGDYGSLIFPTNKGYYSGDTLGNLSLMWYGNIKPDRTVNIVNYMKDNYEAGNAVFYDIYSET